MEPVLRDADGPAMALLDDLVAGRWAAVCATFDDNVAAKLDDTKLAAAWAQGIASRWKAAQRPSTRRATIPSSTFRCSSEQPQVGRVSYDRDGRVRRHLFPAPRHGLAPDRSETPHQKLRRIACQNQPGQAVPAIHASASSFMLSG